MTFTIHNMRGGYLVKFSILWKIIISLLDEKSSAGKGNFVDSPQSLKPNVKNNQLWGIRSSEIILLNRIKSNFSNEFFPPQTRLQLQNAIITPQKSRLFSCKHKFGRNKKKSVLSRIDMD